ncbi:LuxR C-terminal-related transcriptional regulator [Pseudonocardia sp. TMWB2A]|uniref:LuxR C-terminal-related transcriptional regulator n=1 Tax=Pseudonocardia sp. TMWB2A TaxID=687430 RepID=UPI00307D98E5
MPQSLGRRLTAPGTADPALDEDGADGRTAEHRRLLAALGAVPEALAAAPRHDSLDAVLGWLAREAVDRFGFDRVMVLGLEDDRLAVRSTVFRDRPEEAAEAHENACRYPVELRPGGLEVEMLRRRAPALVDTRDDDRVWRPIVDHIHTPGYVASPVLAFDRVVATIHADACYSGRESTVPDRSVLGLLAQVSGVMLERALLAEELTRLRTAVRLSAGQMLALTAADGLAEPAAATPVAGAAPAAPDRSGLTAREREVLELLARGMTSAEIARRLVVSVDTVKVHARNILRKLGASTRAEAVARFLRG